MNTKITDSSVETNEFRLNHREEFTWFKNIITQENADEYGYSEDYDQDDSGYEDSAFYSEMVTDFSDSDNYIEKGDVTYDVPEDRQDCGFRIVTPYQWWMADSPSDTTPELKETDSTTNLLKGFILSDMYGTPDRLVAASVNDGEVIVLPLDESSISDSNFFGNKYQTNTKYFYDKAQDCRDALSFYLGWKIPALAIDTMAEHEQTNAHGIKVTKIYFQVFYGETAPIDDFNRLKEWNPLDFRYDGMTPGNVFEFNCHFIYNANDGSTTWKGSGEDTFSFSLENDASQNDFTLAISYDRNGISIDNVTWNYRTKDSLSEILLANFGPVSFAVVGFEGSWLYPKFTMELSHDIPLGGGVQLELNKYSRSYKQISLKGRGFTPILYTTDNGPEMLCHYVSYDDDATLIFIDQIYGSEPGVCFNLWISNDYELPKDLADGVEWQIDLEAHNGVDSRISVSSSLLPFDVRIPHILYNKNLYRSGYATLSNTIKDDKTYATLSKLFISNVTIQDLDGDGITTSKDQIFAHDGSINTANTKLKNVKITRLKGGEVYDPDKE